MTKTRLAAFMLAAPLLLAACSSNGDTATSAATPTGASDELTSAQPGQEVNKEVFIEAVNKGTAAAKTYAMDMTIEMSGEQTGTSQVTGVVDASDPANPSMQMTIPMPGAGGGASPGNMDMLFVDKTMYLKVPGTAGKYFKMTADDLSKISGQDLTEAMNPTRQLESMKSAMSKVTFVGEEDVNGTSTRRYQATIDASALMPTGTTSQPSSLTLPKSMPYDVWLDDQNRTRKFSMDTKMNGLTVKTSGTLDKFGEPVTVTAPPASQVQPMPSGAVPGA